MILQIILIGTGYHVKRNGVVIAEWASVLILTCFAKLFIAFLIHILEGKSEQKS